MTAIPLKSHPEAVQQSREDRYYSQGFQNLHTSRASSRAFRPGQVVPGEAHLVVTTSSALDGHVELVAYPEVLFLKENLQSKK